MIAANDKKEQVAAQTQTLVYMMSLGAIRFLKVTMSPKCWRVREFLTDSRGYTEGERHAYASRLTGRGKRDRQREDERETYRPTD